MIYTGDLSKLTTEHSSPIKYTLVLGNHQQLLNDLLGKNIQISFSGKIHCIECGKLTKSSFAQGFCYNCFQTSPATEECVLKPELCRAHLDEGRDVEWAKTHHLKPHVVYLAYSSHVKVGVTRSTQVPTRWMDQGAVKAIPFLKTPNRHIAGVAEVYLKQRFSDKTSWKKMLAAPDLFIPDLKDEVKEALFFLPEELKKYQYSSPVFEFDYPVNSYPIIRKSINLDKTPEVNGVLCGIKGQYLLFESGEVMNVRKHNGYEIELSWD